jgi:hypothetical protein
MKKVKFNLLQFLVIVLASLFFVSCNDNDDSVPTSRVTVRMSDAPGDYEEVNVDVLDVLTKDNSSTDDQGWVSMGNTSPGIYDLLDLTGGISVTLADSTMPSGYLGQIRLLLGDRNTVVVDGVEYPLNTPSAQQSGLKLQINQTLVEGVTYDFLLDFDVEHSVVKAGGSGNYNLHPVIKVSTTATSGVIKGVISPNLVGYQVLASVPVGDTTISAYADEAGEFQLNGVPAGTYTVTLTPDVASGVAVKTIADVVVVNGQATDMGNISL